MVKTVLYDYSDLIARVSAGVRDAGLPFGVGGIGRVDDTTLPIAPDLIYAQYPRLGATAALVSRAFMRPDGDARQLQADVARSRARFAHWACRRATRPAAGARRVPGGGGACR